MATSIVRSPLEHEQLADLVAEYEASLPPELRHDYVPVVDGSTKIAIVAALCGVAAGCVFVTPFDNESVIIQRLFVRPDARGRGVARALMQHAVDHAREHGYRRLVLDTDKEQLQAAYQLYLSLGFTECAPFGSVPYEHPTYMELPL